MNIEDIRETVFWGFVSGRGLDDCWLWTGYKRGQGYGLFNVGGVPELVHRVAWTVINGPIPELFEGLPACICHKCDNPPCCNPAHLFLGNNKTNQKDSVVKGRHIYSQFRQKGENNSFALLTEFQVKEIKQLLEEGGLSQEKIAARFGVSQLTISCIKTGRRWSHMK